MSDSPVARQIERCRQRLARLSELAGGAPPDSALRDAVEGMEGALEELIVTLDPLASTREEHTGRQRAPERRDAVRDPIEGPLEPVVWLVELEPLRILHVSRAYEAVWGRPLSALYRDPREWIEPIPAEDRARVEARVERLIRGEPFDEEYRIVRPDGEVRWIHDRGTPFDEGRGRVNRAAGFAEDVTLKKVEADALRESEGGRIAAVLAAERAEARERRSLARDLHDAVGQSLALVRTKLAALRDDAAGTDRKRRLLELEAIVAEVDERIRTLTFRLSPPVLHDLGLAAAAEWLADDLRQRFGLHVQVSETGRHDPLSLEARDALFRSLRELLINVARHARTDKATVSLVQEGDTLTITVEDGGVGFAIDAGGAAGFGLMSIRERVEALGGGLNIESEPGHGTRARLVVPTRRAA